MPARIFCKTGTLRGRAFDIGDEATVGSGGDNAIVLPATTISRQHARIFFDSERSHYVVEDLGSRNGTRVDGTRVRGDERLEDLNVITFAESHDFIFQRVGEGQELPPIEPIAEPGRAAEAAGVEETLRDAGDAMMVPDFGGEPAEPVLVATPGSVERLPRIVLELELSDGLWTRFDLDEGANVLGRSRGCRVTVENDKLSRQHALLTVSGGSVKVQDLKTTNRTYVDGEQISAEVEVEADTALRFGPVRGRVLWEGEG